MLVLGDNYCCVCHSYIGNMMRRVLYEKGAECYTCFRKRVKEEDFQNFLLCKEISFWSGKRRFMEINLYELHLSESRETKYIYITK